MTKFKYFWKKAIAVQNSKNKDVLSSAEDEDERKVAPPAEYKVHSHLLYTQLHAKALEVSTAEPFMKTLLGRTLLHPKVHNFNSAISRTIASRLISSCGKDDPMLCLEEIIKIFEDAMSSPILEYGNTIAHAIYEDILACKRRDPACKSGLEVVLFYKGFASLVCHRVARRHYKSSRYISLWLQSQASAAFGVDVHPAAEIGSGVIFDHATGIVIGETAVIGNNCTILHGVTLGATGKVSGNRHPKLGNDVFVGAGTSILGSINIGNRAKIGSGSIVLKPVPNGATAVGTPAKIIGSTREDNPVNENVVSDALENIAKIGASSDDKSEESISVASTELVFTDEDDKSQ